VVVGRDGGAYDCGGGTVVEGRPDMLALWRWEVWRCGVWALGPRGGGGA